MAACHGSMASPIPAGQFLAKLSGGSIQLSYRAACPLWGRIPAQPGLWQWQGLVQPSPTRPMGHVAEQDLPI